MAKKRSTKKKSSSHPTKHEHHPIFREQLHIGQRAADKIADIGGSWYFLLGLTAFLSLWIAANVYFLKTRAWDPYPFILLNLFLSCLAGFQAPIILMTQNRQTERDRIDAKYDHQINRKAEREIQMLQKEIDILRRHVREVKNHK
jgi:uncharacterized membrane protein